MNKELEIPKNYDELTIHQKITFKGMISNKRHRPDGLSDYGHEEFELVRLLALLSNYKEAINTLLHEWNNT